MVVKKILKKMIPYADLLLFPFVYLSALLLKNIRRAGIQRFPLCKSSLLNVGIFPIRNHYYEPQFDYREMKRSFTEERNLPGISWNTPNN